jgi:hypothetical protein
MGAKYIMTNRTELFHTTNIKVATALLTLGFEKITISSLTRTDGKNSIVFWFNATNADGVKASTVHYGMTKGANELSRKDPDNVINYLRCFAGNRDELITDIRHTPQMVVIEKDGQKIAISANASEEMKRQIAEMI